jgi:hypothetical protein
MKALHALGHHDHERNTHPDGRVTINGIIGDGKSDELEVDTNLVGWGIQG